METHTIKGLKFKLTCIACPEQYDIFKSEKQIGYVRLRYGNLTANTPNHNGKEIYHHQFDNSWKGEFDNVKERTKYLTIITNKLIQQKPKPKNTQKQE